MRGIIKRSSDRQLVSQRSSSDASEDTGAASTSLGPEAKLLAKLQAQRMADESSPSSLAPTNETGGPEKCSQDLKILYKVIIEIKGLSLNSLNMFLASGIRADFFLSLSVV